MKIEVYKMKLDAGDDLFTFVYDQKDDLYHMIQVKSGAGPSWGYHKTKFIGQQKYDDQTPEEVKRTLFEAVFAGPGVNRSW